MVRAQRPVQAFLPQSDTAVPPPPVALPLHRVRPSLVELLPPLRPLVGVPLPDILLLLKPALLPASSLGQAR